MSGFTFEGAKPLATPVATKTALATNNTLLTLGKTGAANNNNKNAINSVEGNIENTPRRAQGNNYTEIVNPNDMEKHLFEEKQVIELRQYNGNYRTGILLDRIMKLKSRINLSQDSVMEHMFYRIALTDSRMDIYYRKRFFEKFEDEKLCENIPGAKTSKYPKFFKNLHPRLFNEARSVDKIEGMPVLPDPIQGLEQLRDYIRLRMGSDQKFDARLKSIGVSGINVNTSFHRINVASLHQSVDTLLSTLATLKTKFKEFTSKSTKIRNKHRELRHRLVKIIGLVKMLHYWGGPTTKEDLFLRERLNRLANRIVEPGSFREELQELEMELKITHSVANKTRAPDLNNMDVARLYEFLEKQHLGLAELTKVLKKDARDIGIIVNSINR